MAYTEKFIQNADYLFNNYKYDSASVYYYKAAASYERDQNWLSCVKNYRLTSNALLKAAKYDTALYYARKALNIAETHFQETNKDEIFEKSDVLINIADINEKMRKFDQELSYCMNALGFALKGDSSAKHRIANIWNKIGSAYCDLDKNDSALFFCQKSLGLRTKLLGEINRDVAESYFTLGLIYEKKNKLDKALELQQKSLQIRIEIDGEKKHEICKNYNEIGIIYYEKGEYDKALEYYQKSLKILILNFGEQNLEVAFVSNNIGVIYEKKAEFNLALNYYRKDLEIKTKIFGKQNIYAALAFDNIGRIHFEKEEFNEALEYYQKAIDIYLSGYGEYYYQRLASSYNNIGLIYHEKGECDKAIEWFQRSLKISTSINEQSRILADIYNNIGIAYDEKGDVYKALEYYEKSLQVKILVYGSQHPTIAINYNNIGNIYQNMGENKKALEYYQKSLEINILIFGEQYPDVAKNYINIGDIDENKGEYDEALKFYQKALNILISTYGENHPDVATNYNNIGVIYLEKGEYDKALEFHQKALHIRLSVYGENHPAVAASYFNTGETYSKKREYKKALQYYQKALMADAPDFTDSDVYTNPGLGKNMDKPQLLKTLMGKANSFYQLSRNQTNLYRDMEASLSTYELAFQLINKMRNEYNIEDTKLLLSENTKKYYSQALQVAMEFDRIDLSKENNLKSYQFMEKGKSATMNAWFNEYKAQHFATIPDTLLDKEKKLRTKIGFISTQIANQKSQKNGYDTLKVNALENENFTCSRKLDSLITYFETAFPSYYQMKYDNKVIPIPEIQKSLDSNTAILNYFVGDSSLFIATITDSLYKMEEIPIDSSFKKQVTNYYRDIKTAEKESFITNSQHIYAKLIKPIEGYISHKEHLIVIPDDYLYYVPFETLVSNNSAAKKPYEDYSKPDYLIKSHAISYHHSATLWYNSRKRENESAAKQKVNFIGFAPVFSKEQNNGAILSSNINIIDTTRNNLAYRSISSDLKRFNPLPYSKDEVTSIVHLFEKRRKEARAYLYSAASESNFKNNVGGYRFIHISSHGFSNDKEPDLSGIVFSQPTDSLDKEDGVLYAGETYNLNLNADLIVLSSCESGLGKLVKGEGIQALSRGFLYAGAPNVIFTLWKVLDKPTKDLMVQFYANVLDGKSYAESLQLAKLNLIKDPATAFPYFWGGFVMVGK
jgi:CHAT domain-containing protein